MAKVEKRVTERPWGFEVWTHVYDEKGKEVRAYQSGAAVCQMDPAGLRRMLELMKPFAKGPGEE
jgi:hypothetical protein